MYYEVVSEDLLAKIAEWESRRRNAVDAFLRLSRRVGASRTRYAVSDSITRSYAFLFNKEPDRKHWKRDRSGKYWLPKRSSKYGKKISDEVRNIQRDDANRLVFSRIFGVDGFLHFVGVKHIGERWIVSFGDGWEFSTEGLRRISDIEVEKLEANEEARDG